MRLTQCHNFHDFRRLARTGCPARSSTISTAGPTMRRPSAATAPASSIAICVPNVLRGVQSVDLSVTVMGQKLAMPFYCSPTALQRLFHHRGRARRRGGGCEIRHDVRRLLARHGEPRGAAQGARHAAGLSVLFPQGSRPQPRHDAARQGGGRRGDDADGRQHHRRQSRARSAHRLFHSLPADARRHAAVRDQAEVGHQLSSPTRDSGCRSSTSTST